MKIIKKGRQSNLELLRIVCMFLIIWHHIAVHGGYPSPENISINDYVIRFFTIGGKLGVNIFVLISGYFLIDSKFKFKKLFKLVAQVLFYAILIFIIFFACGKVEISMSVFIGIFSLWFVNLYVIMYCLSPFINILIENCDKKLLLILILFLLCVQCIVQEFLKISILSDVAWFITLYILAAYIKLYPNTLFNSNKISLPISIVSFIIIAVFKVFVNADLWKMLNIVCVICSVSIFCTFKNFKMPDSKIINAVASTTFGIYLIHDNYLIRNFLWLNLLKCPFHYESNMFIVFVLVATILVFVACMLIDFVRQLLFKTINIVIKKLVERGK